MLLVILLSVLLLASLVCNFVSISLNRTFAFFILVFPNNWLCSASIILVCLSVVFSSWTSSNCFTNVARSRACARYNHFLYFNEMALIQLLHFLFLDFKLGISMTLYLCFFFLHFSIDNRIKSFFTCSASWILTCNLSICIVFILTNLALYSWSKVSFSLKKS